MAAEPRASRARAIDEICQEAATAAGVPGVYRAVIAADVLEPLPQGLGEAQWCAIRNGAPSCSGEDIVFPDARSLRGYDGQGPQHALTSDEHGAESNLDSRCFTGIRVGSDDGLADHSCNTWSSRSADMVVGLGVVTKADRGPFGGWTLGGYGSCADVEAPLLCIEIQGCAP